MVPWVSPKHLKPHSRINYWALTSTSKKVFSPPPVPSPVTFRHSHRYSLRLVAAVGGSVPPHIILGSANSSPLSRRVLHSPSVSTAVSLGASAEAAAAVLAIYLDSDDDMPIDPPKLPLNGDHHAFLTKWEKFANCTDPLKYGRLRLIALYDSSLPDQCSRALASNMPGAGYRAFRIPGYDNGDGVAVPPEGDEVESTALTWQLLHQRNVQLMRDRCIINTDATRVKMKNLAQGDAPMDTYLDAFRKTHIDVHGSATDIMLRVPECVDGMADTHLEQMRIKVSHAMPPQTATRADLRNGVFTALSWEEFESLQTLNEANRRQILGLADDEPYAPAKGGQVTYHPVTGNTVPSVMGIHAVQTEASNVTANAPYDGGRPVTIDEMASARREMGAAQQKSLNQLSLEGTALTAVTSQTATHVKQIITNILALPSLAETNSSSLETLSTSVQKRTNATAGRERPSYKDRKCYNCGENGHIARGCPHKAKKSAITVVSSGSIGHVEFKEQYGSKDEFINCLVRGVEDSPATGDITGEPLVATDCKVSAQVRHESADLFEESWGIDAVCSWGDAGSLLVSRTSRD